MDPSPARRSDLDLVTGAFGNTGSAIARELDAVGRRVRTLTSRSAPADGSDTIERRPLDFDDAAGLVASFDGVDTFYNTYWMRTGDDQGRYDLAVERCRRLITAAEEAGVRRIVHLSVANASAGAAYPYFRGKAAVEKTLESSSTPAAIVGPALVFGGDSVLLNNLAWMLRRLPVFAVAGRGDYRVRPVHVDDLARTCVAAGARETTEMIDAVGPDRPTYRELVDHLRDAVGSRALVISAPTSAVLAGGKVIGWTRRDQILTRGELESTVDGLADTDGDATGASSVMKWITEHADTLGLTYFNETASRRPSR